MSEKNIKYFKEDFLRSNTFKKSKDLINVLLEDDKQYTKAEVEKLIKKYFEGVI